MNHKVSIIFLAAGRAQRYGSLKQLAPIGPNNECILDYSIYDAYRAGFRDCILVIREEFHQDFKDRLNRDLPADFKLQYVYQGTKADGGSWGTGHALLACKELIKGPFLVCNADDYYGADAYNSAYQYLIDPEFSGFAIAYPLNKTLSENGAVNRAFLSADKQGNLIEIEEQKGLLWEENQQNSQAVSMNFWGLPMYIFELLETEFKHFISGDFGGEFQLPDMLLKGISTGKLKIKLYEEGKNWFGLTYKEDKKTAKEKISELIRLAAYPPKLWGK
jgi:NDP-sugar pyrophosphorylase family protein